MGGVLYSKDKKSRKYEKILIISSLIVALNSCTELAVAAGALALGYAATIPEEQ